MVTILITGPECSGKTTLASTMQELLGGLIVEEIARDYLTHKKEYTQFDLLAIAKLQKQAEDQARAQRPDFLIADTGMLVLSIWSEEKYAQLDPWISTELAVSAYDIVLLCRPDLPWEYDSQRENPEDRDRLFELYEHRLRSLEWSHFIVSGQGRERMENVLTYLKKEGHIT